MEYKNIYGVPNFISYEYLPKTKKYCLCIPIINEGERIKKELLRAKKAKIDSFVDIIICDGGTTDGSLTKEILNLTGVNTLLIKKEKGYQSTQLRMGFWWALQRGYEGIITIDGNNKDSIESVPLFVDKLNENYDFVQGSRFIKYGKAINTPFIRYWAVRLIHSPIISITAKKWFTDTTNGFRAYSKKYLINNKVKPFRNVFVSYELLAYLSVRASQLGLKSCEVPVERVYPNKGSVPTKISIFKGNFNLLCILLKNFLGMYNP